MRKPNQLLHIDSLLSSLWAVAWHSMKANYNDMAMRKPNQLRLHIDSLLSSLWAVAWHSMKANYNDA